MFNKFLKKNNIDKSDFYFIIIIILFILFFIYLRPSKKNLEHFAITTVTPEVKDAISALYQADVEAIRNLSSLASSLTISGSLTVPGGLKILGNQTISGNLSIDAIRVGPVAWLKQDDDWIRILSDPTIIGSYNKGLAANNLYCANNSYVDKGLLFVQGRNILAELNSLRADVNSKFTNDGNGILNANRLVVGGTWNVKVGTGGSFNDQHNLIFQSWDNTPSLMIRNNRGGLWS